jgi:hypothetical protein
MSRLNEISHKKETNNIVDTKRMYQRVAGYPGKQTLQSKGGEREISNNDHRSY